MLDVPKSLYINYFVMQDLPHSITLTYGGFVSLLHHLHVSMSPLVPITSCAQSDNYGTISQDYSEIQKESMYYFSGL